MKNWALTNWLDWFERQREGRAQKATLEPCKADQRGSPPKAEGQDREWKLCPGYMPTYSGAYILWRRWRKVGRRRQELQKHKELGDKPVCEELFLPPPLPLKFPKRHSWSYTYLPLLPGPWSSPSWYKEKQPYPLFSYKGKGRQASLGTTGSQNPLRIRQISEWAGPGARPILPNTQHEKNM